MELAMSILGEPLNEVIRRNEVKLVLSDIFLFKNLTESQIDLTVKSLVRKDYEQGEAIFKQGDEAEKFYLIQSGTVSVSKDGEHLRKLGRLSPLEWLEKVTSLPPPPPPTICSPPFPPANVSNMYFGFPRPL